MRHHTTLRVLLLAALLGPLSAYACDGKDVNAIGWQPPSQTVDGTMVAIGDADGDADERC